MTSKGRRQNTNPNISPAAAFAAREAQWRERRWLSEGPVFNIFELRVGRLETIRAAVVRSVTAVPLRPMAHVPTSPTAPANRDTSEKCNISGVKAYAAPTGAGTPLKKSFRWQKLCNTTLGTDGGLTSGRG